MKTNFIPFIFRCDRCRKFVMFEHSYLHYNFYLQKVYWCEECHKEVTAYDIVIKELKQEEE